MLLYGCNPKLTHSTEPTDLPQAGSGRDKYGCIPSAGYQWSVALEKCIRLWEAGIELIDARTQNANLTATLLLNPNNGKAELYLPGSGKGLLLIREGALWQDAKKQYILTEPETGKYQVMNSEGVLLYQTAP